MARKRLEGIGYTALGFGFLFQAAKALELFGLSNEPNGRIFAGVGGTKQLRGLAGSESDALQKAGGIIKSVKTYTVGNIRDRVSYIQKRIREDSLKPNIREKALAVLTRKVVDVNGKKVWAVPEKDYEAEITALFNAVRDSNNDTALRYTRDHIEVDQYHSAEKLMQLRGGDCDDGSILLGAMLRAVGYPIRLRVIQDRNSSTWSHIYLLVGIPPTGPSKWVALDWSVPGKQPGWEAPGAKQVALSGKPSGLVTKLMDFAV